MTTRVAPSSVEAERAVLASMLIDAGVLGLIGDALKPADFHSASNGIIYQTMCALFERGAPVDLLTVAAELGDNLPEVGGQGYLLDLIGGIPTTAHAEYYAAIVKDKAILREVISAGHDIIHEAYGDVTGVDAHAEAMARLAKIDAATGDDEEEMGDFLHGYMARIEARGESQSRLYFESGWYDLDRVWTASRGDLVIVAARPAVGKTAWTLNYAWDVAQHSRVDFWSLEMDRDRLTDRIVQRLEIVNRDRLKDGKLLTHEWDAVARATTAIERSGLVIRKPDRLTAASLRRATLKAKARGRAPSLIVVDYLGLMDHPKSERNDLAVGATSRALKLFAQEARVAIVALAQLNRAVGNNDSKRPALTNLRDSGSLEQDADAVLFLHREAYADPGADQAGPCEVIVGKHRNGPTGTVVLDYTPSRQAFACPTHDGGYEND